MLKVSLFVCCFRCCFVLFAHCRGLIVAALTRLARLVLSCRSVFFYSFVGIPCVSEFVQPLIQGCDYDGDDNGHDRDHDHDDCDCGDDDGDVDDIDDDEDDGKRGAF